jgi:hypothetical protein
MRDNLTQYVQLLFAGTANTDEMQQEILQNTLDKYDDLIAQGKSPEAAYRLSIAGIGDITEILEQTPDAPKNMAETVVPAKAKQEEVTQDSPSRKMPKAIGSIIFAVGLAAYFYLSFTTHAWEITWVIFPLIGAVNGLINAIFDLKEARHHEK